MQDENKKMELMNERVESKVKMLENKNLETQGQNKAKKSEIE